MTITLYIRGKKDKTSRMLRGRLTYWGISFDEQGLKDRPNPSWVMTVDGEPYTPNEIKTRDTLWRAVHPAPAIDPSQAPTICPDASLPSDDEINCMVFELVSGGDREISKYFYSLPIESQLAFIIAVRLQRHANAHLMNDFRDMVSDWLNQKAITLDPYIGWQPDKEHHEYMWWLEN